MSEVRTYRTEHRSDGWHVVSEDGKRHLGGPYETKGQAEERLRQVEAHKDSREMRAITVNAWRFTIAGPDGGKWDQFCKFGEFDKGGEQTVFEVNTCSQIIDNFAGRQNDIGMDYEHQAINAPLNGSPAPALAWYC